MNFLIRTALVISLFGAFVYYMDKRDEDYEKAQQALLEPYKKNLERYLKRTSVTTQKIPAKLNVIYLDQNTGKLDKFSDHNNEQPKGPDTVDSVVMHDCEYVQVGTYSNGTRAMQQVCNFTVIDVATGVWSNWGKFSGSEPSAEIKRKPGSTSDELGGRAIYSFYAAGGRVVK